MLTTALLHSIFPPKDYSHGLAYYHAGRVGELQISSEANLTEVRCIVQGTKRYHTSFVIDTHGTITLNCSCPRFKDVYRCKHLAAAMFAYMHVEETERNRTSAQRAKTRSEQSDPYAQRMLDTYVKRRSAALGMESPAMLVPRLRDGDDSYPAVSLRVGRDKFYVVQNIRTFLDNVARRRTANYGKNLTLDHSIEGFDGKSQKLIQLLMNEFPEYRDGQGRHGYDRDYVPNYNKNELTLSGDAFDRFFEMYLGEQLEADWSPEVELKEGDPELALRLQPESKAVRLSILLPEGCHFFGSARTLYVQGDETILRCSESFRTQVWPLISDGQYDKKLALQDFPTFCSCVLPAIQDYVDVQDEQGLLQQYLPDECVPCFYFDIDGDTLTLTLKFRYADREIADNAPAAATPEIKRDIIAEQDAAAFAEHYLAREGNVHALHGEDEVFSFLTEGLEKFHARGEVYVSDRLRNRRIQPSQAAVGISVSDGLLTLDLNTGDFPPEELEQLYQSLLRRKKYHRLADGRYLALDGSSYETLAEMAHMLQLPAKELKKGKLTMPAFRGLYLDALLGGSEDLRVDRDARFRAMVRNFKSVSESDYAVPAELEHTLRPYQKVGFAWLKTLESSGFGGILADEMGLGKTLEVIAFLRTVDRAANDGPSLVVCPASLILNWGDELTRFAPQLKYALIMGTASERRAMIEGEWEKNVWVTSYELLRSDIEQYRELRFYCCVLDEGQHIKNQSTLASKAVKSVQCRQRFVLTGTPVENRLSELWNLFDFLMPGYLFSHSAFVEKLEKPIVRSKNDDAMQQLRRLVQPFMLRRLKKDVLRELPAKLEYTRRIPMSESERKTYFAAVNETKRMLENGQGKLQVLAALTTLRQICCDPDLCFENYEGETSKLDACVELCSGMVQNGHQILLFSQFTSMLERIQARLDSMHISNFTLRGSTPKRKRAELVRAFNEGGASVFLISLKAGGTGLNLTAADVVIHYDPWWNQAAQDQATDRAHRIGQQAHVQVYKLIMQGSIEERILELQEKKASLMDALSEGGGEGILNMSREELLSLLD